MTKKEAENKESVKTDPTESKEYKKSLLKATGIGLVGTLGLVFTIQGLLVGNPTYLEVGGERYTFNELKTESEKVHMDIGGLVVAKHLEDKITNLVADIEKNPDKLENYVEERYGKPLTEVIDDYVDFNRRLGVQEELAKQYKEMQEQEEMPDKYKKGGEETEEDETDLPDKYKGEYTDEMFYEDVKEDLTTSLTNDYINFSVNKYLVDTLYKEEYEKLKKEYAKPDVAYEYFYYFDKAGEGKNLTNITIHTDEYLNEPDEDYDYYLLEDYIKDFDKEMEVFKSDNKTFRAFSDKLLAEKGESVFSDKEVDLAIQKHLHGNEKDNQRVLRVPMMYLKDYRNGELTPYEDIDLILKEDVTGITDDDRREVITKSLEDLRKKIQEYEEKGYYTVENSVKADTVKELVGEKPKLYSTNEGLVLRQVIGESELTKAEVDEVLYSKILYDEEKTGKDFLEGFIKEGKVNVDKKLKGEIDRHDQVINDEIQKSIDDQNLYTDDKYNVDLDKEKRQKDYKLKESKSKAETKE